MKKTNEYTKLKSRVIKITPKTAFRIKKLQITENETYDSIMNRIMDIVEKHNPALKRI